MEQQAQDSQATPMTYTCRKCSKLDLQVSICVKAINDLLGILDRGYSDMLDNMDPVIKKLFTERGYELKRRTQLEKSKPKGDEETEDGGNNFSVGSC
jgi:hypothetical protein